jgi:hypothetical protein
MIDTRRALLTGHPEISAALSSGNRCSTNQPAS